MPDPRPADASLLDRLPLPLAQLYRRAHNAKTPRDAHDCALYLWEAALKLLASGAIVTYQHAIEPDPEIEKRFSSLNRPSLGHWREFVRVVVPKLLTGESYSAIAKLLDERRADLPHCAALDSSLRGTTSQQTVCIAELLDRIVAHRNQSAHGAFATKPDSFFRPLAETLLAGAGELFSRLDVLAGRQLIAITEVRAVRTNWLVERAELRGIAPWRIASLELPGAEGLAPALAQGLYLVDPKQPDLADSFLSLRPLLDFDAERETVRFLNGRRGKNIEMLCYVTGDRGPLAPDESPGVLVLPPDADESEPEASATAAGRMIGDYELVSELGRGAMGIVYRAKQIALGRDVALKVQPRPNDPKADARFRREIRALARVDHPNLVKVFTSGVNGEQFYYTMELVDGAPLTAISDALTRGDSSTSIDLPEWKSALSAACDDVKRGERPLSDTHGSPQREQGNEAPLARAAGSQSRVASRDYLRQIVSLIRQAANAAHALHEAGVLHRDIKPGNIQVTPDGSQAVLLDLGLAQLADDVEGRLTRTTQFVGTRRYASPEQQIDARTVERRSDVYSLGATLWELIALRPLFNATDETPLPELIARVQRDEPQRLRLICPAVSRDLEAVVHKCLEKRPEHRYATAADLSTDLQRVLEGEPVTARAVSGFDRAVKWVKRRPAIAAFYGATAALILVAVGSVIWNQQQQIAQERNRRASEREARATEKVNSLAHANIASVPFIIDDLTTLRDVADPLLRRKHSEASRGSSAKLAYAIALLPNDPNIADELVGQVRTARPVEILVLRESLKGHAERVVALWPKFVELHAPNRIGPSVDHDPAQLPLAAMLCSFLPADDRWKPYESKLTATLVSLNPLEAGQWQAAFMPLRKRLVPELHKMYVSAQTRLKSGEATETQDIVATASRFDLSADLLAQYSAHDPATLAELLQIADPRHYTAFLKSSWPNAPAGSMAAQIVNQSVVASILRNTLARKPEPNWTDAEIEALAVRQANAATTLLHLGEPEHAWKLLVHTPDPTARSYLVHGLIPRGVDFLKLLVRYKEETDVSAKRAILLALGEYTPSIAWRGEHRAFIQQLLREYRDHPDPGLHGAIDWLLRQRWGKAAELDKIVNELRSPQREQGIKGRDWFVNSQGQTYTIIRGPVEFMMGSPASEPGREPGELERQHRAVIPHSFAIASREVSVQEYLRFNPNYRFRDQYTKFQDGPINDVSWYEAVSYCNWLSEKEGLEPCYAAYQNEFQPGMTILNSFPNRKGYRLPTEAEWEYSCRSSAVTSQFYGRGTQLLSQYGWYLKNGRDQLWSCGRLKPNDLGLFDMLGNGAEWNHDAISLVPADQPGLTVTNDYRRLLRGGSFFNQARFLRCANRGRIRPDIRDANVSFRLARTLN